MRVQLVVGAQDWPEDNRQVLVVGDHLILGAIDTSSLLVDNLIGPIWVAHLEGASVVVVVAHEQHVEGSQSRVLVDTRIAGHKATSGALFRRARYRQEGLAVLSRGSAQHSTLVATQTIGLLLAVAVNVRQVQEGGVLVELLTWTQLAGWADARADKVQTGDIVGRVELVALWHIDWPAAANIWILATINQTIIGT